VFAVTKRTVFSLLAGAKRCGFGFVRGEFLGFEVGALMRSVAKWLFGAQTATAPVIRFSFFQFHMDRCRSGDFGFCHVNSSCKLLPDCGGMMPRNDAVRRSVGSFLGSRRGSNSVNDDLSVQVNGDLGA
jgi:hypothetical protein